MSSEVVIRATNLCKSYCIYDHPFDRVRQILSIGDKRRYREFQALKDISFEVRKGETLGIVGRNGSGKSTLLQLICGILKPTSGSITVHGRVSALLELGAGFHPEFSGRENVYMLGAIMGLTKAEMDARLDHIAAFADIGEFLDQPVKMYSSGMFVRLAFAAVTHTDPDILVIDEALAVGDEAFQRKCFECIDDLINRQRKTVIVVSHNLRQMERICNRIILLENGLMSMDDLPNATCGIYHLQMIKEFHSQHIRNIDSHSITKTGEIEVVDVRLSRVDADFSTDEFEMHAPVRIGIRFRTRKRLVSAEVIVGFHTPDSVYVASTSSAVLQETPLFEAGEHYIECFLRDMMLTPGIYHVRLAFIDRYRRIMWDGHGLTTFRVVPDARTNVMRMPQLSLVDMPFTWCFVPSSGQRT